MAPWLALPVTAGSRFCPQARRNPRRWQVADRVALRLCLDQCAGELGEDSQVNVQLTPWPAALPAGAARPPGLEPTELPLDRAALVIQALPSVGVPGD